MLQVFPVDFLRAFMDPTLFLELMKTFINKNISRGDPASSSDIMAFLRVKLTLSFYKGKKVKISRQITC